MTGQGLSDLEAEVDPLGDVGDGRRPGPSIELAVSDRDDRNASLKVKLGECADVRRMSVAQPSWVDQEIELAVGARRYDDPELLVDVGAVLVDEGAAPDGVRRCAADRIRHEDGSRVVARSAERDPGITRHHRRRRTGKERSRLQLA
jgi:hypothetical protein